MGLREAQSFTPVETFWDVQRVLRRRNLTVLNNLPQIQYGFSERDFGNMSTSYPPSAEEVWKNRRRFATSAGFPLERMAKMNAKHGDAILDVRSEHTWEQRGDADLPVADILITRERELPLVLLPADCTPIIIVDHAQTVAAMVHAGREGIDKRVCQVAIKRLGEMGYTAEELVAGIGPTAGCYGLKYIDSGDPSVWTDRLMVSETEEAVLVIDEIEGNKRFRIHDKYSRPMWTNLAECNQIQLQEAGIPVRNISVAHSCTRCEAMDGRMISHSIASETHSPNGRFMAYVMLQAS